MSQNVSAPVEAVPDYAPPSRDLAALMASKREGLSVWRTDLTRARVAEIRQKIQEIERLLAPPSPALVKSWLAKLAQTVANPPAASPAVLSVFFEVCDDLPGGVWTAETRKAWCRQPARNGFPVGSRWPSPAELYAHLWPFADTLRGDLSTLRELLSLAEQTSEYSFPNKPDEREKEAVRNLLKKWRKTFEVAEDVLEK